MSAPKSRRTLSTVLASLLVFGLLPQPGHARTQGRYTEPSPIQKGLLDVGAIGCSLVYTPIKACYAAGGTVAGGLVFLMSAGQSSVAAGKILQRSTRGDWFIHPDHLTGRRRLRFRGSPTIGPGR